MLLQCGGSRNKSAAEAAFQRLADAHHAQHPHIVMGLEKLIMVESPEQVDKAKMELKAAYPRQLFAEEFNPSNPNALFFRPLREVMQERNEESLIRNLCDGRWPT